MKEPVNSNSLQDGELPIEEIPYIMQSLMFA